MTGFAQKEGLGRVGFGCCSGKVSPYISNSGKMPVVDINSTISDRYMNFSCMGIGDPLALGESVSL